MGSVGKGEAMLRQLSGNGDGGGGEGSKRWGKKRKGGGGGNGGRGGGNGGGVVVGKKRVMVVIEQSTGARHAMMWALTHVTNKGDLLTLLHVLPHHHNNTRGGGGGGGGGGGDAPPLLAHSLGSLCKACKPEVEVEALVIKGPKLATVLSQVRKLEASVLVLSQTKPSPFSCLIRSSREEFVEECISKADCLTLAVRKQSKGVGGYLVSTRWQKNFWLLA